MVLKEHSVEGGEESHDSFENKLLESLTYFAAQLYNYNLIVHDISLIVMYKIQPEDVQPVISDKLTSLVFSLKR